MTGTPRLTYPLWTTSYGWASQEVVVADTFVPTVLDVLGDDFDPAGADVSRTVEVIPEPDNDHDPDAVAVRYTGDTIGYLPRPDALRYRQSLLELLDLGYVPTVEARIWAAERTEPDDFGIPQRVTRVQVHLNLTGPETMVPLNDPPGDAYTIVPPGAAVQVLKTIDHFDVLRCYPTEGGTAMVLVTLHAADQTSARTTKRVIEVQLDGRRIGQLSPSMSEKFLPAAEHFEQRGLLYGARAVLNASSVSAKVSLHVQRAFEMSNADLDGEPTTIPARGIPVPSGPAPATRDTAPLADTVQSGVTAGGTITVTEKHTASIVVVDFAFDRPLTAWQRKVAGKVFNKAAELLATASLEAPASVVVDSELHAYAPLDCAQEFVDALIGIEDSDFSAAQEFCER